MRFHRDLIAVVLPLVLLLPSFGPLLGTPEVASSCRCQGDSCCLRHGRPASVADEPSHAEHGAHGQTGGHGAHSQAVGHGAHGQTPEAADAEASVDEGAACHKPSSSHQPSDRQSAGVQLSSTCDPGSPVPAPPSVRRDAISGLRDGGHAVLIVSHGEALTRQWKLPMSYFAEPTSPPPRSA